MATTSSGLTPFIGFFAEDFLDLFLYGRHAGHAADQHDGVDVAGFELGVFQSLFARLGGFVDQLSSPGSPAWRGLVCAQNASGLRRRPSGTAG